MSASLQKFQNLIQAASNKFKLQPTPFLRQGSLNHPIKAVVFDVYGTLLLSGQSATSPQAKFPPLLREVSTLSEALWNELSQFKENLITQSHLIAKKSGTVSPEITINEIWLETLRSFPLFSLDCSLEEWVLREELSFNPCHPIPGVSLLLELLRSQSIPLGIISNAQWYTPLVLETLYQDDLSTLGFDQEHCLWSYQNGYSKPNPRLFQEMKESLHKRQISPSQCLYLGNDEHKDILPALEMGFQTALYVGDQTSIRHQITDQSAAHFVFSDYSDLTAALRFSP